MFTTFGTTGTTAPSCYIFLQKSMLYFLLTLLNEIYVLLGDLYLAFSCSAVELVVLPPHLFDILRTYVLYSSRFVRFSCIYVDLFSFFLPT